MRRMYTEEQLRKIVQEEIAKKVAPAKVSTTKAKVEPKAK